MIRWPRRNGLPHLSAALVDEPRAQRKAPFSLTPPGAEARIPLDRLDVPVPASHRRVELVQRHVLAPTDERLHRRRPLAQPTFTVSSKTPSDQYFEIAWWTYSIDPATTELPSFDALAESPEGSRTARVSGN